MECRVEVPRGEGGVVGGFGCLNYHLYVSPPAWLEEGVNGVLAEFLGGTFVLEYSNNIYTGEHRTESRLRGVFLLVMVSWSCSLRYHKQVNPNL